MVHQAFNWNDAIQVCIISKKKMWRSQNTSVPQTTIAHFNMSKQERDYRNTTYEWFGFNVPGASSKSGMKFLRWLIQTGRDFTPAHSRNSFTPYKTNMSNRDRSTSWSWCSHATPSQSGKYNEIINTQNVNFIIQIRGAGVWFSK